MAIATATQTDAPLQVWQEQDGRLLRLRLARPKANIVDAAMIAALTDAFEQHLDAPALSAVILDAEGPHFSFGASVEEHLPDQCAAMLQSLHRLIKTMLRSPVPILVAVRGQCLGGGLEVALAGNLLFAGEDAKFGQPEIKLGVFAPAASCLLPARIGQAQAEELLFSGRSIAAGEAQAMGLLTSVSEDPAAAAEQWARDHLLPGSASSLRFAVRAARRPLIERLCQQLDVVEALYLEELMQTRDAVEGLTAFVEKRPVNWEHR